MLALIGLGIQTGYAQETGVKEANKAENNSAVIVKYQKFTSTADCFFKS